MTTYFVCSGAGATAAPYNTWNKAAVSIPALMTGAAIAGGDIIYVHNTHNYLAGAAITWTLPEGGATGYLQVLCVDGGDAAFTSGGSSMGSTVGSLTTGAQESTNGNFAFVVNGGGGGDDSSLFIHGLGIKTGSNANEASADITVAANYSKYIFSACNFWMNSTSSGALFTGSVGAGADAEFKNCTFRFGATSQQLAVAGIIRFIGCSIHASGSAPTTLFTVTSGRQTTICDGCDWSLATNIISVATIFSHGGFFRCNNCTIGTPTTGTHVLTNGITYEFQACAAVDGTNGADVLAYYREDGFGVVEDDQTVYVTSGPAQGTQDDGTATSYSLKMTPNAAAKPYQPLYTPWIYVKVASTGSKTISMKAADTEAAVLKNSELWMEVEYMGGAAPANSPQTALEGTFPLSGTYQDVTAAGSNLTDTGEAWTGIVETGTYTLSKTVTLDEQGYIRCRVGLGKDTTNPVYVDPKITVA